MLIIHIDLSCTPNTFFFVFMKSNERRKQILQLLPAFLFENKGKVALPSVLFIVIAVIQNTIGLIILLYIRIYT